MARKLEHIQKTMTIPALRKKIANADWSRLLTQILNQIPTQGNNPWIDGVNYDAKLINPDSDIFTSINFNQAKEAYFDLGFLTPKDNDGQPVEISISFVSEPTQPGAIKYIGRGGSIEPWSNNLRTSYLQAYKAWEDVANIKITEKQEEEDVNIQYYRLNTPSEALGAHQGILSAKEGQPQTSWINARKYNDETATNPGSSFLEVAIHEIGHGLGLSHPHDRGLDKNNPSPVFPGLNPFLGYGDRFGSLGYGLYGANQMAFTVMSYNRGVAFDESNQQLPNARDSETEGHVTTPMALDILAMQIKYGYNTSTALEDNTYKVPTSGSENSYWKSIWDCGGNDTIDARTALNGTSIELRAAPMNAYRPQSDTMSERYNWEALGIEDLAHAATMQSLIDIINPTGSLLGTTYQFAVLGSQVVKDEIFIPYNEELNDSSLSFTDWVNKKFSAINEKTFAREIEDIAKSLAKISNKLAETDPVHADLKGQTYLDQQAILQESAANAGGYISQELGNQGGFTIAAGTTIENALGSNYDDSITGNHVSNELHGYEGNDQLSGRQGDDRIYGGLGDDLIDGGFGDDQLHGDDGSNIFRNCKDGYADTLYIRSTQNPEPGNITATDIIENLDVIDQIIITDLEFSDLRIEAANLDNRFGVGIYAGDILEAIYLGGELSIADIEQITMTS